MSKANIDDALELVSKHFRGMTDQDGEPYVMHCLRVMHSAQGEDAKLVALMHDLVEDTPVTLTELRKRGFSDAVLAAMELITHDTTESYADYVVRLSKNPIATEAKLADLRDNASMHRVLYRPHSRDRDLRRIQRYVLSYQYLLNRIDESAYREQMADVEETAENS